MSSGRVRLSRSYFVIIPAHQKQIMSLLLGYLTEHFVTFCDPFSHLLWRAPHTPQRAPHWNNVCLWGDCHLFLQFWIHTGGLQGTGVYGQWALEWL
jgi:hypothetical protein